MPLDTWLIFTILYKHSIFVFCFLMFLSEFFSIINEAPLPHPTKPLERSNTTASDYKLKTSIRILLRSPQAFRHNCVWIHQKPFAELCQNLSSLFSIAVSARRAKNVSGNSSTHIKDHSREFPKLIVSTFYVYRGESLSHRFQESIYIYSGRLYIYDNCKVLRGTGCMPGMRRGEAKIDERFQSDKK